MRNILLTILCCLLLLLSNNNAANDYENDENVKEDVEHKSDDENGANRFINHYDSSSTLDAYAYSYVEVVNYKFHMIEIQTYKNRYNVEGTIKPEILRLEHLYQSKWAKEFLESIGTENETLVNLYTDEYNKALDGDKAFNREVLANPLLYSLFKTKIERKWEDRKNLDIAEGIFFADISENLQHYKVDIELTKKDLMQAKKAMNEYQAELKWLEAQAVIASNAYRDSYKTGNDAIITEAYTKARIAFADGTDALRDKIKLLEMKRIEFLKCKLKY
ncbi:unnamed protein product [Trichobilharzia szidati]|nr:unnamed protein product [Trichobilharzia szidati]